MSTGHRAWTQRLLHIAGWAAFVVLGTVVVWFGTLAVLPWNLGYTYDPGTGLEHGPPMPGQFLVCGVLLVGIAVVASWNRSCPVVLLPPSLTLAWSVTVSAEDITGLWLVGAGFMAFGSVIGTLAVLDITRFARPEHRPPRSPFARSSSVSRID